MGVDVSLDTVFIRNTIPQEGKGTNICVSRKYLTNDR